MLQYDKSASVLHVDWFHPWKPNRFSPLWIWLSLTSQRFHTRMYWSHFIHHSKAIHWVINPLAYLAAGDSTAKHWGRRTHNDACTHTHTHFHINTRAHILQTHAHISLMGSPWWPTNGKKTLRSDRNQDTLLDPSDQPQQKNLPLGCLKKKKEEEEEGREGEEKKVPQNSITQSKPTPFPPGVISAPFKSLITHKTNNILTPW